MLALTSILPILLTLSLGYLTSRHLLPDRVVVRMTKLITPMVWLLLVLIGAEFGAAIGSLQAVGLVLKTAALLVLATTLLPCVFLWRLAAGLRGAGPTAAPARTAPFDWRVAAAPLKECLIAMGMVTVGVLIHLAPTPAPLIESWWWPSSNAVLLLLIFLVGLDLAAVKIGRHWLTWRVLSIPAAVIVGSLLGAFVVHLLTQQDLRLLFALSTGFGWFTLSSVLVGGLSGEIHGAIALLTDLGRELLAVVLLYLAGRQAPRLAIAAAGATALDSTLPIVRQTCAAEHLPAAVMSGFVLTVLAPFFITFFLTV